MSLPTYQDLQGLAYQGVRIEITGGCTTWAVLPGALHNGVVDDIRQNLTRLHPPDAPCGCFHSADTYTGVPGQSANPHGSG